jgi:3-hydroxybutyryl-CoA dehydrogenase
MLLRGKSQLSWSRPNGDRYCLPSQPYVSFVTDRFATAQAGRPYQEGAGQPVGRGKIEAGRSNGFALAKVTPIGEYAPMSEADLIIEAAMKRVDYRQSSKAQVLAADAIMVSNTNLITRMANHSPDPAVYRPPLFQSGSCSWPDRLALATAQDTTDRSRPFAGRFGQGSRSSQERTRLCRRNVSLLPMINEAVFVLTSTRVPKISDKGA